MRPPGSAGEVPLPDTPGRRSIRGAMPLQAVSALGSGPASLFANRAGGADRTDRGSLSAYTWRPAGTFETSWAVHLLITEINISLIRPQISGSASYILCRDYTILPLEKQGVSGIWVQKSGPQIAFFCGLGFSRLSAAPYGRMGVFFRILTYVLEAKRSTKY